jgi:hypothetical protein
MSSFLKKRKKEKQMYSGISVFFLKYVLQNNNGLKKKFKRGTLNLKKNKFKTNAILGRQMN